MKFLALALALCGSAGADQTCKAKANQQKLAGEALVKFVERCEFEALEACQDQNAHKPDDNRPHGSVCRESIGSGIKMVRAALLQDQFRLYRWRGMRSLLGGSVRRLAQKVRLPGGLNNTNMNGRRPKSTPQLTGERRGAQVSR